MSNPNTWTINVRQDEDPINPREDFDHIGTMVCWHRRYNLGDKHEFGDVHDFQEFVAENPYILTLPLYLYDHSGITMNTTGFSCPWDSGQVGVIYVTKERAIEEWGEDWEDKALACLKSEVEEYDDYLRGNVWGYVIENEEGECVESCWGFIGDPEHCRGEAESIIEWHKQERKKQHFELIKKWIREKVPLCYRHACPIS